MNDAIAFSLEPIAGAAADVSVDSGQPDAPQAERPEEPVKVNWKRDAHERKILFVDDDERFLNLCNRRFEASDYKIYTANGAEAALAIMTEHRIDLIISDMSMPGITGAELLHEVERKFPETIRVIISGKFDLADTIEAINRGHVYKYLTKPFNDKDLKLTIYQALLEKERREAEERRRKERQENVKRRARQLGEMVVQTRYKAGQAYDECLTVLTQLATMSSDEPVRIADVSVRLAECVGESEASCQQIRVAALLRDLAESSKVGQPISQMSGAEKEQYFRHPVKSAKLVHGLQPWREAAFIIKSHHERFDGKGFPCGIKGEEIPLGARIIAIATHYVQVRSARKCSHDDAVLALAAVSERFDPALLTAIASLEDEEPLAFG